MIKKKHSFIIARDINIGVLGIKSCSKVDKNTSSDELRKIGDRLDVNWDKIDFDEFCAGVLVETEHGTISSSTNITNDDSILTAKIALAHLNEIENYYTLLAEMEAKGKKVDPKEKD